MARFIFYDDKLINILLEDERPSGGAAVQAYGWIRGLLAENQEIYVMTNTYQEGNIKEDCRDIKLAPLFDPKKGVRWLRWAYYRFPFIYSEIKKISPDYLYQGIPAWTSFLLGLICRSLNIKYLLRISNDFLVDDRFYTKYSKFNRFFQQMGIRLSYCILCQNDYQYNIIKQKFPRKLIMKLSNPIFKKYDGAYQSASSRNYISWIGLFQYQKNLKLLFDIATSFKDQQFQIAGKQDPKCDAESLKYLDKLKNLPNVKIVGFLNREEILRFISISKFLLNTSHYEGFSNTFLEAMSAGTPIISSVRVNPDNIITNHSLGIVYKDIHDLKAQLEALTPTKYQQMSDNTLQYIIQHHDYRALSGRLLNFLENQTSRNNPELDKEAITIQ